MRSRVVSSGVSGRVTRGDAVRQNGHSGSGAATAIRMRAQLWTAAFAEPRVRVNTDRPAVPGLEETAAWDAYAAWWLGRRAHAEAA